MTTIRYAGVAIAAAGCVLAVSSCSPPTHPRAAITQPSTHAHPTASVVAQPSAQQIAARRDPAVRCGNKVRMALALSSPTGSATAQIRSFARAGASSAERHAFATAMARYASQARHVGAERALADPRLSFRHLVATCRTGR